MFKYIVEPVGCICITLWDPYCCDGKTYGNTCEAGCAGFDAKEDCTPGGCPPSVAGEGEFCGGFAGIQCEEGLECVDDPNDKCDPKSGGADCGGICQGT